MKHYNSPSSVSHLIWNAVCPGPLLDFSSHCTRPPVPTCLYDCCTPCCISRGGWSLCGCGNVDHRIYLNPAGYFPPNFTYPPPSLDHPFSLPIVSPTSGDLTRPSGLAQRDLIGDGWQEGQLELREQALQRFHSEGTTVFVFLWTEVGSPTHDSSELSDTIITTRKHRNPLFICA